MSPAILDTILARLALLFLTGAGGDLTAARHAASQMLAAYGAATEDELRLATEIISFSFHALEALSQAATPDMPLTKVLRLRGSAVSLSRESHKAQRKLDQLQRDRRAGIQNQIHTQPAAQPVSQPPRPRIDNAVKLVETTRQEIDTASRNGKTWTQAYNERQVAKRLAARAMKQQAKCPPLPSNPAPDLIGHLDAAR